MRGNQHCINLRSRLGSPASFVPNQLQKYNIRDYHLGRQKSWGTSGTLPCKPPPRRLFPRWPGWTSRRLSSRRGPQPRRREERLPHLKEIVRQCQHSPNTSWFKLKVMAHLRADWELSDTVVSHQNEFFIKMRAAYLLSPSFKTRGRMGASKAALILIGHCSRICLKYCFSSEGEGVESGVARFCVNDNYGWACLVALLTFLQWAPEW